MFKWSILPANFNISLVKPIIKGDYYVTDPNETDNELDDEIVDQSFAKKNSKIN
jgi:hypothetical protein